MIIEQYITESDYYRDLGESDNYRLIIFGISNNSNYDRLRFIAPKVKAYSKHCVAINRNSYIGFWINENRQCREIFLETVRDLYPDLYDWFLFNPEWL